MHIRAFSTAALVLLALGCSPSYADDGADTAARTVLFPCSLLGATRGALRDTVQQRFDSVYAARGQPRAITAADTLALRRACAATGHDPDRVPAR